MIRPAKTCLKIHGGKGYLAQRIIDLLPPRDSWHLWREPYFGGGAVTLALDPEGLSEAVNDIDRELVNFWSVLSDKLRFEDFSRAIEATPFSEGVWRASKKSQEILESLFEGRIPGGVDRVRRAVRFFIVARQSRQGLGRDFATPTQRIRRGMNENVSAWLSAIEGLPEVHERLKRVEIRNMDACEFIRKYDHERAVFYCDPPYVRETRFNGGGEYKHEMTLDQHRELLMTLKEISGRFLLSGYRHPLYEDITRSCSWNLTEIEIDNKASGKKQKERKTECIWRNF